MKIKWTVAEKETGLAAIAYQRGWPTADYENGEYCANIICSSAYHPVDVKDGNHEPLKLRIADHSQEPWKAVQSKATYATLKEAKAGLLVILKANPQLVPKMKRRKHGKTKI